MSKYGSVSWVGERDHALIQRFIVTDISNPALLTDIVRFCQNCEALIQILRESGHRVLAEHAASVRRKWLIRLAFYIGPLPQLAEEGLPSEVTAELRALGVFDPRRPRYRRPDLSNAQVRHNLYRLISLSSTNVDLNAQVLGSLSTAGHTPMMHQLTIEIKPGGFVRFSPETHRLMSWYLRIATPDYLDELPIELIEDKIPRDIVHWLIDFLGDAEQRNAA